MTIGFMAVPRPLAGRYAFARRIRGTQRTIIWIARDQQTRVSVVASVLPGARAAGLKNAVGVTHPNAAAILGIIESVDAAELPAEETPAPESFVVVAEHIEGRSLQQRLEAGPVALENAVEWTAAVADALATLHARGAVHGALSPRSVLVVRPEPAVIPTLTHLVVPPSGAYCSPERVTGAGPSVADDIWALGATLYTAIARRAPFGGGSRTELARAIVAASPKPLDDADTDLWAIVARALSREPGDRFENAAALRDALNEWTEMTGRRSMGDFAPAAAMVGMTDEPPNVGEVSLVAALVRPDTAEAMAPLHSIDPGAFSDPRELAPATRDAHSDPRELAPLPPPVAPRNPGATAPNAEPSRKTTGAATPVVAPPESKPRKSGSLALGVVAALAAAAGIGVFAGTMRRTDAAPDAKNAVTMERAAAPSPAVPPPPSAEETVAPATSAPELVASAPAESAAPTAAPPGDVNACAAAVLPERALGASPAVPFLCTDRDLWGMTRRVDLQVLKNGAGEGQSLWVHLGRYDLAAVATLRERCCPGAVPFTAAVPKGICETLAESIHAVARDPSPEHLDRYTADVECYVSHGIRYPAEWWDRIKEKDAREYFDRFLKALRPPP